MLNQIPPRHNIIALSSLRPTQFTVGMLQMKYKRAQLRKFEKKPAELVNFILEHPVRVVLGPTGKVYVIDHHHLALALIKEDFETAPMEVEEDFSSLPLTSFWKKMQAQHLVHLIDADGKRRKLSALPKNLKHLQDDPYRSLAGFVCMEGGFLKVRTPFAEFKWAEYFKTRIRKKLLRKNFDKALGEAVKLASHKEAAALPGFKRK